MLYSIIIPVYRGEKTIAALMTDIMDECTKLNINYEVIFVYDCGKDESWAKILELKKKNPDYIKAIHLTRNFGQHNAIICGFKYAIGDFFITMDEDLQHSPSDFYKLIDKQVSGDFDVVYGKYSENKHTFFRKNTSWLMKKILAFGIPELHPDYSPYRLIRRDIARKTLSMNNSYTFLDGYLSWITTKISSVQVAHSQSSAGRSSYTFAKLLEHSINIFITFSKLPIRLLTTTSILIFFLSFIYASYVLARKLIYNDYVTGFATFAIILGFGIGSILLGLGIIGEYLYRVNLKTTKRPNFFERTIV